LFRVFVFIPGVLINFHASLNLSGLIFTDTVIAVFIAVWVSTIWNKSSVGRQPRTSAAKKVSQVYFNYIMVT
jgi:hypothetical protein